MRKMVLAALVVAMSIGALAATPSTAQADDRHGRRDWRGDRGYRGGHWDRHGDHWHWHSGRSYSPPVYRYRTWSPYYYSTPRYAPYGSYYSSPGFYLNFRF